RRGERDASRSRARARRSSGAPGSSGRRRTRGRTRRARTADRTARGPRVRATPGVYTRRASALSRIHAPRQNCRRYNGRRTTRRKRKKSSSEKARAVGKAETPAPPPSRMTKRVKPASDAKLYGALAALAAALVGLVWWALPGDHAGGDPSTASGDDDAE